MTSREEWMRAPTTRPTSRRVDWLELFFDLVFVVIIKQLTDLLHGNPGPADFLMVAGLLVLAWAAWLNVTTFTNLAGDDSIDRRVPVLISMAGVGIIAVAIPTATSDGAVLFVIGYALARIAIWPLWAKARFRTGLSVLRPTVYGPGIAVLWLASIAVPQNIRPWSWLLLVVVELVFTGRGLAGTRFVASHLIERVGLFTMIVLGESVVELILAIEPGQSILAWIVAAEGFVLICGFWWIYFQAGTPIAERALAGSSASVLRDVIGAAHYLVVLGLIGVAAGLGSAIEHADDSHLAFGSLVALCGGSAIFHVAHVLIGFRYGIPPRLLSILSPFTVLVAAIVLIFGRGWAPWVVVLVMIVDLVLHGAITPVMARRIRVSQAVEG